MSEKAQCLVSNYHSDMQSTHFPRKNLSNWVSKAVNFDFPPNLIPHIHGVTLWQRRYV